MDPNATTNDASPGMSQALAPEVATILARLTEVVSLVRTKYLSKLTPPCTGGGYCVIDRATSQVVAHDVLLKIRGIQRIQGVLDLAKELAGWLDARSEYVTSGQGGYRAGAIRLDRYILAVTLNGASHQWAEAIAIATVKRDTNLSHMDLVAAIHAMPNQHLNAVLDLAQSI